MKNTFLMRLIRDQRGTSAVEMGLICGLIVIAMFTALQGFANASNGMWTNVANQVQTANNASGS
ncbi:MAG: Flp family type IVb pilin [Novosphingobium sp.]|jgi:Flp pilus assembly pilin Flp|nr:Flp family type IVb pilin [Novosphingobium sp.]